MRLKRLLVLWLMLIAVLCESVAQVNKYGYPEVTPRTDVPFESNQIYLDVIQDNRGVVYALGDESLVKLSGARHDFNEEICKVYYTLGYDSNRGRVYLGGASTFGYLAYDKEGKERYVSLVNTLPEDECVDDVAFDDHIYVQNDTVYFLGRGVAVVYDIKNNKSERWFVPELSRCVSDGSGIYTTYYPTNENKELCLVTQKGLVPVGPSFDGPFKVLLGMEKISPTKHFIAAARGVYIYDEADKTLSLQNIPSFSTQIAHEIGQADKVISTGNGKYAINNRAANKLGSVIVFDSTMVVCDLIGKSSGAKNNVALNLYASKNDGVLWSVGYDITSVSINSPVRRFTETSGYTGDIVTLYVTDEGTVILLTTDGLFMKSNGDSPYFFQINNIDENATSYHVEEYTDPYTNERFTLVGTLKGVYKVDRKGTATKILEGKYASLTHIKADTYHLYGFDGDNEMRRLNILPGLRFEEDTTFRLTKTSDIVADDSIIWYLDKRGYGIRENVTTGKQQDMSFLGAIDMVCPIGEKEYIFTAKSTGRKIFVYDKNTGDIEKCHLVDGFIDYDNKCSFIHITPYGEGYIAKDMGNNLFFVVPTIEDKTKWEVIDMPYIPKGEVNGIFIHSDSTIYIRSYKSFYTYRTDGAFKKLREDVRKSKYSYNTIINKVYADGDTIFHGTFPNEFGGVSLTQPDSMVFTLPYNDRSFIRFVYSATCFEYLDHIEYSYFLEGYSDKWSDYSKSMTAEFTSLYEGEYIFKVKARNIHNVESTVAEYKFIIEPPIYRTIWAYMVYCLPLIGVVYLATRIRNRRLIKRNHNLQRIVEERTKIIRQHEQEMLSNINYASRIQTAALTPDDIITGIFPEHFVMYKPHSIVSGDFYVVTEVDNHQICVVADCTGHGVSGGFLSMLGLSVIRQIVLQTIDAAEILNQLRKYVISNLHQKDEEWSVNDGMDASIIVIDKETKKLTYAGANSRILIFRGNEDFELKGDRMPVSIHFVLSSKNYTNRTFQLESGDMVYAFSDGYLDQFGGEDNSKFMITRFKELLCKVSSWSADKQKEELERVFNEYKGDKSQTDDVLVMGVRIE